MIYVEQIHNHQFICRTQTGFFSPKTWDFVAGLDVRPLPLLTSWRRIRECLERKMVWRVILLVGEETRVFGVKIFGAFYHQLILHQGHVRCIFGRLRKCAVLGHCSWIVGAGSVKEQGFTLTEIPIWVSGDLVRFRGDRASTSVLKKGRKHEGWSSWQSLYFFYRTREWLLVNSQAFLFLD